MAARSLGLPPSGPWSARTTTTSAPATNHHAGSLLERRRRDSLSVDTPPASSSTRRRSSSRDHFESTLLTSATSPPSPSDMLLSGLGVSIPNAVHPEHRRTSMHYAHPRDSPRSQLTATAHPRSRRMVAAAGAFDMRSSHSANHDEALSSYLSDGFSLMPGHTDSSPDRRRNHCFEWHDQMQSAKRDVPPKLGERTDTGGMYDRGSGTYASQTSLASRHTTGISYGYDGALEIDLENRLKKRMTTALLTDRSGICRQFNPEMRKSPAIPGLTPVNAMASPLASPNLCQPTSGRGYGVMQQESESIAPLPMTTPSLSSSTTSPPSPAHVNMFRNSRRMSLPFVNAGPSATSPDESRTSVNRALHGMRSATDPSRTLVPSAAAASSRLRSSTLANPIASGSTTSGPKNQWPGQNGGPATILNEDLVTYRMTPAQRLTEDTRRGRENSSGRSSDGGLAGSEAESNRAEALPIKAIVLSITLRAPKGHRSIQACIKAVVQLRDEGSGTRGQFRAARPRVPYPSIHLEELQNRSALAEAVVKWSNGWSDGFKIEGLGSSDIVSQIKTIMRQ